MICTIELFLINLNSPTNTIDTATMDTLSKRSIRSHLYNDIPAHISEVISKVTTRELVLRAVEVIYKRRMTGYEPKITNMLQVYIRTLNLYKHILPTLVSLLCDEGLRSSINWISPVSIADEVEKKLLDDKNTLMERIQKEEIAIDRSTLVPNVPNPCKHCGKKTVRMTTKNTRSFDEPATLIFSCLSCGEGWLNY